MVLEWKTEAQQIRRMIGKLGARARTQRLPETIRQQVLAYVERGRGAGVRWRALAAAVHLSVSTIHRWRWSTEASLPVSALVPVALAPTGAAGPSNGSSLTLVTPSGHRIEGLTVHDAMVVVRALA
jgi:hypothetical protein